MTLVLFCRCYPLWDKLQYHDSRFKSGNPPNALPPLSHRQTQKGAAFLMRFKEPLTSALTNLPLIVRSKSRFTLFSLKVN